MKTTTAIRAAVKLCYDAFTDYARIVQNVPVIPKIPQVSYKTGKGWEIDGQLFKLPAEKVIDHYDQCQRYWHEEIKRYRAS